MSETASTTYPDARRGDLVEVLHGHEIADPYRWLEDPNSAETKSWVAAQSELTERFLEEAPARDHFRKRIRELFDYVRYSAPIRRGERYFILRNDGLQDQAVIWCSTSIESDGEVLLDPNTLSEDGTVAVDMWQPSPDGRFLAYAISRSGSDWQEWRVRDVETKQDLDDVLEWSKFSEFAWSDDGAGAFYSAYDPPKPGAEYDAVVHGQRLVYHRIETPQSDDIVICESPEGSNLLYSARTSEDGRFLIIGIRDGSSDAQAISYVELEGTSSREVRPLIEGFDDAFEFLGNDMRTFWFLTKKDAPRSRVVAIDIDRPGPEHWRELIAERPEAIQGATRVGSHFVVTYLRDAVSKLETFDLEGRSEFEVDLPELGSVAGVVGQAASSEGFFYFASYLVPVTVYRLDADSGRVSMFRESTIDFDPTSFVCEHVFYASKDGTRIPMFVVRRTNLEFDGSNPTHLYGYGGFNVSTAPSFSPVIAAWIESGGIFAAPCLRGGGEYGEEWHLAGTKHRKQNVFDDFVAAAEWMIEKGYTSTPRLGISGRSNGGLLAGACMTQRPDLFGASVPAVGVLDMLRFHKFTIGWAWIGDYGSPDDPEEFESLLAYSPLHNLREGTAYPPTLVVTADHDDRVVPAHSYKFAASLQAAHDGDAPVLIRIDTKAGHGGRTPVGKSIEEGADILCFLARMLRLRTGIDPV